MNGGRFSFLIATGALSALAFVLMPNSPSRADFLSGREAYLSGDYVKAFEEFLPSAMQGNVRSRIGLGLLLARGQGMKPDFVGSYAWFDMASVEGNGEHVVVRILARTNRDFLRKHMTDEQVARAKLRSTMILATPETLKIPVPLRSNSVSHTRKKQRTPSEGASRANNGTSADPDSAMPYQIQLAALRNGYPKELLTIWSQLTHRHAFLNRLHPVLVRIDLGDSGVYEALRVGQFDSPRSAYVTCDVLIEDSQDCFVVAK
jgi:hypothetical protein